MALTRGETVVELLGHRLVGRDAEEAKLAALAAAAAGGSGQAAFIVGEAGLGKTALLRCAAAGAENAGVKVVWGLAHELDRARPFSLISACLGVSDAPVDVLQARAGDVLRGEARYGLPGAPGSVDFATVEAMIVLVEEMCAQGPLALFLDDLQWADPASLCVLRRLVWSVGQLPLLIIGAFRPVPRVVGVGLLGGGLGAGDHAVLELGPLDASAVSLLVAGVCGGRPGPRLLRLCEGAAGNPLYVGELIAALQREGAISTRRGSAEVAADCPAPPLTMLITHRLAYLRDEVLQVLRVASVLGAGCTVGDLAAVLGGPTHVLLTSIADAEAAGVLADTGRSIVFRHDLVRQALYDAVPGSVRSMLHIRAAHALMSAGAVPERVAVHLLEAAPTDGGLLVPWLLRSAVQLTARAPALALRLLGAALDVADPADPRYDELRLHHVVAQLSSGLLAEAEESARIALARVGEGGLEFVLRWILVQAAFARGRPDVALAETRAACRRAGVSPLDAVRFHAFGAVCLFALGQLAEAGAVAAGVRRTAAERDDGTALAYALQVLAAKRFIEAPDFEALELARQASRLTPETIHPAQWLGLQLALANCYMDLDLISDGERTLAGVRERAEPLGGVFLPWYHLSCALLAFHGGRWQDAIAEIEAGLDPGIHFAMSRALRALATLIAVHQGRRADAEAHLAQASAAQDSGTVAWFYEYVLLCAEALMDEAQGHPERAYSRLAHSFDSGIGHLPGELILCFLTPDLVRLAVGQGDRLGAQRYAQAARSRAEHSGAPYHLGDACRCQGLIARDPELLLQAARHYREAPRPLSEAHAYTDAAEMLAMRGQLCDARVLLDQALVIYGRLEAAWDAARATSRLRAVSVSRGTRGPRNSGRLGWEALTATERIVAGHVADGHSNPETATRMCISRRTVSTHVSNILRKLGMTSRVELATEVIRRNGSAPQPPGPG
ncbi:AAA family ATPase [Streptomyces sp. NPDC051364]|uniref:helix-turn-helix transcriptional regulator n=1 Tax=Streptomyces sp. NPDC051364 TaxID=3155799 RepID=UPI00343F81B5